MGWPYYRLNTRFQRAVAEPLIPNSSLGCVARYYTRVCGAAVRLSGGWLYLVAILDWFARYVVSWPLSDTLEIGFVPEAVEQALALATSTIWNSDQGSNFTSPQYTARLSAAGVQISMDVCDRARQPSREVADAFEAALIAHIASCDSVVG
jgi:putative transposase